VVAAVLFGLGVAKLVRNRHPRFGGMAVGSRDVAVWSFLMASAHGAGLMVVPFLLRVVRPEATMGAAHAGHGAHSVVVAGVLPSVPAAGLGVALVHTAGYLLVTGLMAVVVYEWLGLRLLGKAWFNVDRLWAGALMVTAVITPLVA
jgi:hypothetical protein